MANLKRISGAQAILTPTVCLCGCKAKVTPGRAFLPGHDMKLRALVLRILKGSKEHVEKESIEYLKIAPWMERGWLEKVA